MGTVKQTNFRIDEDTADKFRNFCSQNNMNQAQGMDHIMQIVEMNQAKEFVPGRRVEIESFEKAVKDIQAAYLNSLELYNDAEELIREEFASKIKRLEQQLDEQDQVIEELRSAVKEAEEARNIAETVKNTLEEKERNAVAQMEAAKKTASDQERISTMLTAQLADVNDKLGAYDTLKASEQELRRKLEESERQISDLRKTHDNELKQAHTAAELDKERAVIAKERELLEQIRQVERENAKLQAQVEQLMMLERSAESIGDEQ